MTLEDVLRVIVASRRGGGGYLDLLQVFALVAQRAAAGCVSILSYVLLSLLTAPSQQCQRTRQLLNEFDAKHCSG